MASVFEMDYHIQHKSEASTPCDSISKSLAEIKPQHSIAYDLS